MELITTGTMKYLQKSFRSTRFVRGHPFYWTSKLGPDVDHTRATGAHCAVNLILGFIHTCFVIFRAFQVLMDSGTTPTKMIYMIFLVVYYLGLLSYQFLVVMKKDELVSFIRGFCRFVENGARTIGGAGKGGKILKLGEFLLGSTCWTFRVQTPIICALSIVQPESPEFLSSLFMDEHGEINWIPRSLSASIQTYFTVCVLEAGLVCCLSTFFPIFIMIELADRLKKSVKEVGLETKVLRIRTQLQLVIDFYNDLFAIVFVGGHISVMMLAILCTHIAVRSQGWISVACGYFGPYLFCVTILVINLLAEINRRSWSTLEMMRERAGGHKILSRKVKSMRALRIRAGSCFFYDKMLVITTVQIGVENAINLLLMY